MRFFKLLLTITASAAIWILATNSWSDSGKWIDTETWND